MKMTTKDWKKSNNKLLSELAEATTQINALIEENKELKTTNNNLRQQFNSNVEKTNINILAYRLDYLLRIPEYYGEKVNLILSNCDYNLIQEHRRTICCNKVIHKLYMDVADLLEQAENELKGLEKEI